MALLFLVQRLYKQKSCQMIQAAENGNRNAHTIEKHGRQTTNEQQKRRANEGIEPDGTPSYKTDSSRWLGNVDTSDGIAVTRRQWEEQRRINPNQNNDIKILFDKPVGEGYLRNTNTLIKTNTGVFRFNEKGDLITSYPLLPKTTEK